MEYSATSAFIRICIVDLLLRLSTASPPNQTSLLFNNSSPADDIESMQNPLRQIQLEENKTSNKTYSDDIDTTETATTESPPSSTVGYIYLRGHRIRLDHHLRTPRPLIPKRGQGLKPPGALHKEYMKNKQNDCWPQCEDDVQASKRVADDPSGAKRTKKDSGHKTSNFYNYKLLHDTSPQGSESDQPSKSFYVWIFAAATLTIGSLVSLSACFAFCYCNDRVRKSREKAKRRRNSKQGEYERVGSVSSIVSHSVVYEDVTDATVDSVTII